jgi:hypothetical protein
MAGSGRDNFNPVAGSIPYDDSVQTPLSGTDDVQEMLDYLKNQVAVSASPGFTWGRSGNVSTGTWLLNDSVPSNTSGRLIFLNSAEIVKIFIANEDATILSVDIYSHDGNSVNLTLLGTVTTAATRNNTFTVSYSVALNKQIGLRLSPSSANSGKNMVAGCLIKGSTV